MQLIRNISLWVLPIIALLPNLSFGASCRIPIDESNNSLNSLGGAPDAAFFSAYQAQFLPDGSLAVHDPVASRVVIFDRSPTGHLNCSRPSKIIEVSSPPISSIAINDGTLYGIDIDGQIRQIYPQAAPGPTGEKTQGHTGSVLSTQRLLTKLAHSNPIHQSRGIWPGDNSTSPDTPRTGEIGLSPNENRLVSVPNGTVLLGKVEYQHAFEWITNSTGNFAIWEKAAPENKIRYSVTVPGLLGAVDIISNSPASVRLNVESIDLDNSGAVRVTDHILTYDTDAQLIKRQEIKIPAPTTRGNWIPMNAPSEPDPLNKDRVYYFYRDNSALVVVPIDLTSIKTSPLEAKNNNIALAPQDPDRKKIIDRAEDFLNAKWSTDVKNLNSHNSEWRCIAPYQVNSARWAQPLYLKDIREGSTVYGVPYLWGGKISVIDFISHVSSGKIAGNICTKVVNRIAVSVPDSTGIDCSGFVSRVWELGNGRKRIDLSTVAIATDRYSTKIDALHRLQAGDVLNKAGSHVRLFATWVRTPFGLRVRSYESTVDSVCSGTCLRDLRARAYVGYSPRGYPSTYAKDVK